MDRTDAWRECFAQWPDEIPRRGILVTGYAEQVAFDSFYTHADFLLITRNAPDALGARQLMILYSDISALKIVDVVPPKAWSKFGFSGASAKRSSAERPAERGDRPSGPARRD